MADGKKERKLTEAEQKRLDRFNETCAELEAEGYKSTTLTIGIVAANVIAIVVMVILLAIAIPTFILTHPECEFVLGLPELLIFIVALLALIVVHELIHGLTWSFFTPNGFADIEFGIMMDSLTPYCACGAPLAKGPYILGALMPLIVLGIIPTIVAYAIGSMLLLYIGLIMTVSAMGDIMIVIKILRFKSDAAEILLYDHPTEAGSVIFER